MHTYQDMKFSLYGQPSLWHCDFVVLLLQSYKWSVNVVFMYITHTKWSSAVLHAAGVDANL